MVSAVGQIVGLSLAVIGFLGTIITCALPSWKGTVVCDNRSFSQVVWEGLWKMCGKLPTGQMQCYDYHPEFILTPDVKAARALTVISIIVEIFGIVLAVIGSKYTPFVKEEGQKYKAAIASGVIFIIAGLFIFICLFWTTNIITHNDYNPLLPPNQKRELGAAIYIGWVTTLLLFLSGGLLCGFSKQD